ELRQMTGENVPGPAWSALRGIAVVVLAGAALAAGGLAAPASARVVCATSGTQPFLPWGDSADYVLAPGGALEPGTNSWRLADGAELRPGNEAFHVHDTADRYSLWLPA